MITSVLCSFLKGQSHKIDMKSHKTIHLHFRLMCQMHRLTQQFLRDAWIRTQRVAKANKRATNLAIHLYLPILLPTQPPISIIRHQSTVPTQPPISLLSHHLHTQLPISLLRHTSHCLATHLPTYHATISLLRYPSPYLVTNLTTQPPISLLSSPSNYLATHLPTQPHISILSQPSPYIQQSSISILSHLSPYSVTHLTTQPPIYSTYLASIATHLHIQSPISLLSHAPSAIFNRVLATLNLQN